MGRGQALGDPKALDNRVPVTEGGEGLADADHSGQRALPLGPQESGEIRAPGVGQGPAAMPGRHPEPQDGVTDAEHAFPVPAAERYAIRLVLRASGSAQVSLAERLVHRLHRRSPTTDRLRSATHGARLGGEGSE
jgi:hypothetical protein